MANRAASLRSFYDACKRFGSTSAVASRVPKKKSAKNTSEPPLVTRNEVGVQMLSRELHAQVFQNVYSPTPDPAFIQISRDHLAQHGLDPSQGSTLPDISFPLPPLQGTTIDEHFHRIGSVAAEPALSQAHTFASSSIPELPDTFVHQPGWTKYNSDGSYEHVEDLGDETLICFDVETMPPYSPYPIIACAVTPNAWYCWLSPWLLGQDSSPEHLIPIGDPQVDRMIVGHNVSYDRARIREEYDLKETRNRFIDTMSLHVAVKGISSHQRPSWMTRRKAKLEAAGRQKETVTAVTDIVRDVKSQLVKEKDPAKIQDLERMLVDIQESLPQLRDAPAMEDEEDDGLQRWEDITSMNSLAEVAYLYHGIEMDKEVRNDFMKLEPSVILAGLESYISYCAADVSTTHAVYTAVFPLFREACPSPVTFAGVMTMGSSFLPVNESWDTYIKSAEDRYQSAQDDVRRDLHRLARDACRLMPTGEWKEDPWLTQLDWTPKKPNHRRRPPRFNAEQLVVASDSSETPPFSEPHTPSTPFLQSPPPILHIDPATVTYGMLKGSVCCLPKWYHDLMMRGPVDDNMVTTSLPYILQAKSNGGLVFFIYDFGWVSRLPLTSRIILASGGISLPENHGLPPEEVDPAKWAFVPVPGMGRKAYKFLNKRILERVRSREVKVSGIDIDMLTELVERRLSSENADAILKLATKLVAKRVLIDDDRCKRSMKDVRYRLLDWTPLTFERPPPYVHVPDRFLNGKSAKKIASNEPVSLPIPTPTPPRASGTGPVAEEPELPEMWPKWYWDLAAPKAGKPDGTLDLGPRQRAAPLLLRLRWLDFPLFWSTEHGWIFRVDAQSAKTFKTRLPRVTFKKDEDEQLRTDSVTHGFVFYKLPHKDGDKARVASPLTKMFLPHSTNGTLSSPSPLASTALALNAECSYWISARDRIMNQMVVWDPKTVNESKGTKWGMILPQVVTMGTVTRRAIEKTWLTASNAKKNRVGSELKAMVRAPPGYAIVGADVDSEELWISSVMGDAQFGLHGASAIGWMTLEGTKAAGTDLHSKTASILGISRDQAKVFNYSRIYGAGMRHAELLLLQANTNMLPTEATQLAKELYAQTKGKKARKADWFHGRSFWHGGTESFLFNKLEAIALSDTPQTPALGCGITSALSKEYLPEGFGTDFMPSRINWVVQSSGVDYLHLLIVAMQYLISTYDIRARYLISVHDEVRFLVAEEDTYRAALALQIANLWTRSQFVYRLGFSDLPQGVAFFSAVDIDHVLRKEVFMDCVTPSNPNPIPHGESLDIYKLLEHVPHGLQFAGGRMIEPRQLKMRGMAGEELESMEMPERLRSYDTLSHRASNAAYLQAQATQEAAEVKALAARWRRQQEKEAEARKARGEQGQ